MNHTNVMKKLNTPNIYKKQSLCKKRLNKTKKKSQKRGTNQNIIAKYYFKKYI